jgi:hypothetical protein
MHMMMAQISEPYAPDHQDDQHQQRWIAWGPTEKRVTLFIVLYTFGIALFCFGVFLLENKTYFNVATYFFYPVPVMWIWYPMWMAARTDGWGPRTTPLDTGPLDTDPEVK